MDNNGRWKNPYKSSGNRVQHQVGVLMQQVEILMQDLFGLIQELVGTMLQYALALKHRVTVVTTD